MAWKLGTLQKGLVLDMPLMSKYHNPGTDIFTDRTPYENHGANNGADVDTDHATFVATNGDYVNCGNDSSLDITDNLTIETWFKSNDNSLNNALIGATGSWQKPYSLFIRTDAQISFGFNYNDTRRYYVFVVPSIGTTQWHHAVVTYSNPNAYLYLDRQVYTVSPSDTSVLRTYAGINIGRVGGLSRDYFDGDISNARIYNRALTPAEVKLSYDQTKGLYL